MEEDSAWPVKVVKGEWGNFCLQKCWDLEAVDCRITSQKRTDRQKYTGKKIALLSWSNSRLSLCSTRMFRATLCGKYSFHSYRFQFRDIANWLPQLIEQIILTRIPDKHAKKECWASCASRGVGGDGHKDTNMYLHFFNALGARPVLFHLMPTGTPGLPPFYKCHSEGLRSETAGIWASIWPTPESWLFPLSSFYYRFPSRRSARDDLTTQTQSIKASFRGLLEKSLEA